MTLKEIFKQILTFNRSNYSWDLPIIAGLSIVGPLLLGFMIGDIEAGKLASIGALVILYIQSDKLVNRMMILMVCGFMFIFSYTIGTIFSFSSWLKPLMLGLYTFGIHFSIKKMELTKPPGNFFFIMVTSIAIAVPHNADQVATSIGHFSIGVMLACMVALIYSVFRLKGIADKPNVVVVNKKTHGNILESIIFGFMTGISLMIADLLKMTNPYWVPISCMAIMQGVSTKHIWARAIQRIIGTFIGLGLTWLILHLPITPLGICISILILQIVVEFWIPRNYGIAVIFVSMMTIFMAESNQSLIFDTNHLIATRFLDILLGCTLGIIGGWLLYHERIRFFARKKLQKLKTGLLQ